MLNGATQDHMVPIAVYAAERQDIRSSWSRRAAWNAIDSGSRVDDEITIYVNMGGWALRELRVGFRLHYRLSCRLSIFWCFDTITINYRYRYRRFFCLIVSKCYLFRYPTLIRTSYIALPYVVDPLLLSTIFNFRAQPVGALRWQ